LSGGKMTALSAAFFLTFIGEMSECKMGIMERRFQMKDLCSFLKYTILLAALFFFSCQTTPSPIGMGDARCDDIAARGFLNVLDINLLFSEVQNRDQRLEDVADFAANNDVDVLLLQEVVNGALVKTENSAQDLREILRDNHNLDYNISTAFEAGLPGLLSVANAILSRCEIRFSQVKGLPLASEIEFDGLRIAIERNVQLTRLQIPELGKIDVYNTHLCARCEVNDRAQQLDALLEFVDKMEMNMPGDNPSVLGGDFNFDRFDNQGAEKFLWEKIVDAGFIDAYAEFIITDSGGQETLDTLCEDEDNADEHCTVGVSELDGPNARRIDYIFTRKPSDIRDARVVFNTLVNDDQPTVSDHAGVFISLSLP
jgi:maltose 6'-phosphate phosphatase